MKSIKFGLNELTVNVIICSGMLENTLYANTFNVDKCIDNKQFPVVFTLMSRITM